MTTLIYAAIGASFLILVIALWRTFQRRELDEKEERGYVPNVSDGRWLDLSARIFDPADVRWLMEDLAFPTLAKVLAAERKRLALHWLKSLQAAFEELVRTPAAANDLLTEVPGDWQMLWLTLRFKLLISYALLVVRTFGPYHRLIPSFGWVQVARHTYAGREAFAESRISQ